MIAADRALLTRAGALAILLVLIALLWVGPIGTYFQLIGDGADAIAHKAALLQRYRALADAAASGRPNDSAQSDPSLLLPAVPDAQAVALLQETVKSAAAAAQVQIQGFQVLRSEGEAGALRIGVRIRASGDAASLGRLLYAIESARPLLYPDNLQIQSHAAAPGTPPSPLQFQLDVAGFRAGSAS